MLIFGYLGTVRAWASIHKSIQKPPFWKDGLWNCFMMSNTEASALNQIRTWVLISMAPPGKYHLLSWFFYLRALVTDAAPVSDRKFCSKKIQSNQSTERQCRSYCDRFLCFTVLLICFSSSVCDIIFVVFAQKITIVFFSFDDRVFLIIPYTIHNAAADVSQWTWDRPPGNSGIPIGRDAQSWAME